MTAALMTARREPTARVVPLQPPVHAPASPGLEDMLALIDQAGGALATSRMRVAEAEAKAEEIAMVAVAQVKAISARLAETEKRLKALEEESSATIKSLKQQVAVSDDWAATASREAQEATARAEAAEARAARAEESLCRVREALRQKLAMPIQA